MENKTLYQKELEKVLILLGVGLALTIMFVVGAAIKYQSDTYSDLLSGQDILLLIGMILYPVGIVYGWREILQWYKNMRSGDRYKPGWNVGANTVSFTAVNIAISLTLTIFFGWIIGVYKAAKMLILLKRQEG